MDDLLLKALLAQLARLGEAVSQLAASQGQSQDALLTALTEGFQKMRPKTFGIMR